MNLDKILEFANHLADISGKIAKKYYRDLDCYQIKSDNSPVSLADKEIEKAITKEITKTLPDHSIIGEEFGKNNNTDSDFKWLIDPIDGTKSFISGKPTFTTLISFIYKNEPQVGIIDQPILEERFFGVVGRKAKLNDKEIKASANKEIKDGVFATTSPFLFKESQQRSIKKISDKFAYSEYGGDAYNYALLSLGLVDCIIESGLKPHDFCALKPIVIGAGKILTDWEGRDVNINTDGNLLASNNQKMHQEILDLLKEIN